MRVAALWPERVVALVSGNSYNIQDIARAMEPASAAEEASFWYQYYFHSERGRRGLTKDRRAIARLLWRTWSPTWAFDEATFERTASAFDNPDFVEVVIHSYRHRYGLAPGDPRYAAIEAALAAQPRSGPGDHDRWRRGRGKSARRIRQTSSPAAHEHRVFRGAGHNLPQERPGDWAQAVIDARRDGGEGWIVSSGGGVGGRPR